MVVDTVVGSCSLFVADGGGGGGRYMFCNKYLAKAFVPVFICPATPMYRCNGCASSGWIDCGMFVVVVVVIIRSR